LSKITVTKIKQSNDKEGDYDTVIDAVCYHIKADKVQFVVDRLKCSLSLDNIRAEHYQHAPDEENGWYKSDLIHQPEKTKHTQYCTLMCNGEKLDISYQDAEKLYDMLSAAPRKVKFDAELPEHISSQILASKLNGLTKKRIDNAKKDMGLEMG